jgi:hypothetical protein
MVLFDSHKHLGAYCLSAGVLILIWGLAITGGLIIAVGLGMIIAGPLLYLLGPRLLPKPDWTEKESAMQEESKIEQLHAAASEESQVDLAGKTQRIHDKTDARFQEWERDEDFDEQIQRVV